MAGQAAFDMLLQNLQNMPAARQQPPPKLYDKKESEEMIGLAKEQQPSTQLKWSPSPEQEIAEEVDQAAEQRPSLWQVLQQARPLQAAKEKDSADTDSQRTMILGDHLHSEEAESKKQDHAEEEDTKDKAESEKKAKADVAQNPTTPEKPEMCLEDVQKHDLAEDAEDKAESKKKAKADVAQNPTTPEKPEMCLEDVQKHVLAEDAED